jgi:CheY-like chemotaxis protein
LSAQDLAQLSGSAMYAQVQAASERSDPPALDLRFARALIQAHGGRFWAENTDTGKTMHLALGVHDESQPIGLLPVTTSEPVILLVDSDLAFRRELQEILVERGYVVETADNGLQAWQYLLAHPAPALILFDLMLPAMDGWELHSAIKANAALGSVPTVVVSGLDRYRIEASLPDAHGYIEKPIRTAQLFEVVQRHVASPARPRTLSVRPAPCL